MEELARGGEDDEPNLGVAEDGELLGLLEQPPPPLGEGHLPRRQVVDPPYRNPLPLPRHPPPSILPWFPHPTAPLQQSTTATATRSTRRDESHMFTSRKRNRNRVAKTLAAAAKAGVAYTIVDLRRASAAAGIFFYLFLFAQRTSAHTQLARLLFMGTDQWRREREREDEDGGQRQQPSLASSKHCISRRSRAQRLRTEEQ